MHIYRVWFEVIRKCSQREFVKDTLLISDHSILICMKITLTSLD